MLKMRSKKKSKQIKLLAVVFFCMRFKQWESENTYRRIEWKTFFHFCSFSLCTATLYCPLPHWINPKKITICGSKTKQNLNDFQSKDIKQLWTWKMCCCLVVRIFIPKIKEFLTSWFDWLIRKKLFHFQNEQFCSQTINDNDYYLKKKTKQNYKDSNQLLLFDTCCCCLLFEHFKHR